MFLDSPQLPTCEDCKQWMLNDDWTFATRRGERIPRTCGVTPCHRCPKIPKGEKPRPENAVELSPKNWLAYLHYQACRAVGQWPDDPIVRRNARIIRQIEDMSSRTMVQRGINLVAVMLGGKPRVRT